MSRHRSGGPTRSPPDSEEDEDDAFATLSRRTNSKRAKTTGDGDTFNTGAPARPFPAGDSTNPTHATTSSMKRHHITSDSRKARMDSVLMELEAEKRHYSSSGINNTRSQRKMAQAPPHHYVPDKKGSFVDPTEEHLTTNLFVGNLAPSITEEQLTDLFRQFGELYSVKIMWPRTAEERTRNRHTGFVCFMNRRDAEDAMEACNESDPFNVGRRIVMSWGKNVKKVSTGSREIGPGDRDGDGDAAKMNRLEPIEAMPSGTVLSGQKALIADDMRRGPHQTMQVQVPHDLRRAAFITTVASFVAKDGYELERIILEREYNNPLFSFLWSTPLADSAIDQQHRMEQIFYKWRVYAFCNGDSFHTWRTDPFVMLEPFGCLWLPPPMDIEASRRETEQKKLKEEAIRQQKLQRTFQHVRRDYMTGRRLEQAKKKGGSEGTAELTQQEIVEFDRLFRHKLCCSRDSICQAMSFCFEKSAAALHISALLKDLLMDRGPHISVETRIARLFLLSDVLFNSQQPGVRNAFRYRDEIERMLPDVFGSLADDPGKFVGRMTHNKLASAVSSVLGAWTNWSVYSPAFLDELHARFEGREVASVKAQQPDEAKDQHMEIENCQPADESDSREPVVTTVPKGDWTIVDPDSVDEGISEKLWVSVKQNRSLTIEAGKEVGSELAVNHPGREPFENADGEPLEEVDGTGEVLKRNDSCDGAPLESDLDAKRRYAANEPMDDATDVDGAPLDDSEVDGEPIEYEVEDLAD